MEKNDVPRKQKTAKIYWHNVDQLVGNLYLFL